MAFKAKHVRFAHAVADGQSFKDAAIVAGYPERWASSVGSRLSRIVKIRELIRERQEEVAVVQGLTKEKIIKRYFELAMADSNQIVKHRRACCRFCHGLDFQYQWTEREYDRAYDRAVNNLDDKGAPKPLPIPDCPGGFGFDVKNDPHPKCPECFGQGVEEVFIADTSKLKGGAKALYAGAKQTKNGIEVKLHDQLAPLAKLAEIMGLAMPKKMELTVPDGINVNVRNLKELSDDDLNQLIQRENA